jgi:hypothetical protein
MPDRAFARRQNAAFVSYAHADREKVLPVARFLRRVFRDAIFFDENRLDAGAPIGYDLEREINASRSFLLFYSEHAERSSYVRHERKTAASQAGKHDEFKRLTIRLDGVAMDAPLEGEKFLEMPDGFNAQLASQILRALSPNPIVAFNNAYRPVYFARGWHAGEDALANLAVTHLHRNGFHAVGDALDHANSSTERVLQIMESCGATLVALPNRGDAPEKYKYLFAEIELARKAGHEVVVISAAPATVVIPPAAHCIRLAGVARADEGVRQAASDLVELWKAPPRPAYAFIGHGFDRESRERMRLFQEVFERVSAIPCLFGEDPQAANIVDAIIDRVSGATIAIMDIGDEVNTLIECGVALGARRALRLIAQGERQRPPFLLRNREVSFYSDGIELVALAHELGCAFRRQIYSPGAL